MELCKQNSVLMNRGPSIVFLSSIAQLAGFNSAVFFGYLIAEERIFKKTNQLTEDGFFYLKETTKKEICFSDYQQRSIGKKLEKHNLTEIKYIGMPAKKYFKINRKTLEELP